MPLYEYICHDCGQTFEKMVRFSEQDQLPTCPTCGSVETQKQLSTFATRGGASQGFSSPSSSSCSGSGRFS
jgi:putative FmdB family regulatory protein